jgi:hypothetical protein
MTGDLRFLYHEILDCESGNEWRDVFKKSWSVLEETRKYYNELKNRPCERWPEICDDESWNLYSVSRVSDIMLLRFQEGETDGSPYRGPNIQLENYVEFFEHIGFTKRRITAYHPFDCEIVGIVQSEDPEMEIVEIKWPALMLGNMMFSRAGVVVKAPANRMVKGIGDKTMLYWAHWRKNRETLDPSVGWGHNSQWRTGFRRDFDLGDRYAYNVDGWGTINDLRFPAEIDARDLEGLAIPYRIDLLRNRCLTTVDDANVSPHDLCPYSDYFEEAKGNWQPYAASARAPLVHPRHRALVSLGGGALAGLLVIGILGLEPRSTFQASVFIGTFGAVAAVLWIRLNTKT